MERKKVKEIETDSDGEKMKKRGRHKESKGL